ncbi:MAG: hypothetical protein MJ050_09225 [Phascolarctobacterium sp.]|nr:hypothetical protein [Phascolarctobacterium sp.]
MSDDIKLFCADLVLADAITDMAEAEGITKTEARRRLITSKAYQVLYKLDTGIWGYGPDYFVDLYKKVG